MKKLLRKFFQFILIRFESGTEEYLYKPSHRIALIIVGFLFTILAATVVWFAKGIELGYFLPVLVFGGAGILCLIIGLLGEDRAVAKIWGSR